MQQSGSSVQEIENVSNVIAKAPMKEQGDLFSSCVPVSVKRSGQDEDADENVDADHVRTVRPVESEQSIDLFTQREDIDIDFRVSGLSNAVVKQAENFRVRELVKKIESHPHRRVLQADLQQNNAYNPFSEESKAMIREMDNVELFELCETIPKVQCPECLLYWNRGIIYCSCGHLLMERESNQHFHQWRLDAFSIPNYEIKKVRPRGARHGKTEAQKEHFIAHTHVRVQPYHGSGSVLHSLAWPVSSDIEHHMSWHEFPGRGSHAARRRRYSGCSRCHDHGQNTLASCR